MPYNKYFSIDKKNVLSESFDDEVIIVNMKNGNYYSLKNTGQIIWDMISNNYSLEKIVQTLNESPESKNTERESEIKSFLSILEEERLISIVESQEEMLTTRNYSSNLKTMKYMPPKLDRYTDMQDLILLDPIHEVGEEGWPTPKEDEDENDQGL